MTLFINVVFINIYSGIVSITNKKYDRYYWKWRRNFNLPELKKKRFYKLGNYKIEKSF